ncbi:ADAMTS-like protein 1 [Engraulis encrasicolus]|uniref:ADAMTS-like protein 1 n=1 Tax=Engraulis encrasicolus TaxID=184585 RepID=UPI002FD55973
MLTEIHQHPNGILGVPQHCQEKDSSPNGLCHENGADSLHEQFQAIRDSTAGPGGCGSLSLHSHQQAGSDSESSLLQLAEYPKITLSWRNVSDLGSAALTAVVGGWIRLRLGANLTQDCPVTGVPQSTVSWHKKEGALSGNTRLLPNGSLLLHNITLQDYWMYTCVAANPFGKSSASSHLHRRPGRYRSTPQSCLRRQAANESLWPLGSALRPWSDLEISYASGVRWSPITEGPLDGTSRTRLWQRSRACGTECWGGGRVLEVNTLHGRFNGRYSCQTQTASQLLSAWVHIGLEEFGWQLGNWSVCSASCGNRGTQTRKLRCVNPDGSEVPPSTCHHLPRPMTSPQACNTYDCPASWVSTPWSKCSSSCGRGFRQRQVSCQQVDAAGTVRTLSPSACSDTPQPTDREDCTTHTCTTWLTSAWGQCTGRCLGPGLASQSRTVMCKHLNSSIIPGASCDPKDRTSSGWWQIDNLTSVNMNLITDWKNK